MYDKLVAKERLLDFLKLHFTPLSPPTHTQTHRGGAQGPRAECAPVRATCVLLNKPSGHCSFSAANMRKGKNTSYSYCKEEVEMSKNEKRMQAVTKSSSRTAEEGLRHPELT